MKKHYSHNTNQYFRGVRFKISQVEFLWSDGDRKQRLMAYGVLCTDCTQVISVLAIISSFLLD